MSFQPHEVGVLLCVALKCAHQGSGSLKNLLKGTQLGNAEDRFQTQAIRFQVLGVSVGFKGKIGGNLTDNPNAILHIQHAPSKVYETALYRLENRLPQFPFFPLHAFTLFSEQVVSSGSDCAVPSLESFC